MLEVALADVGAILGEAGIPWIPLKGMGGISKLYQPPECRPTSDLDLLIPSKHLERAREVLAGGGWRDLYAGETTRHAKGYNWPFENSYGVILELHYRLWGSVDPRLPEHLFDVAQPDPDLENGGCRIGLAETFTLAAVHYWITPPPRPLVYLYDLHLIARSSIARDLIRRVDELASTYDLQLFLAASSSLAAFFWPNEVNMEIAQRCTRTLKISERLALAAIRRRSDASVPLGTLFLARLVAGRESRTGLGAPFHYLVRRLSTDV